MNAKIERRSSDNKKLKKAYDNIELLFTEIGKREIPSDLINIIYQRVEEINNFDAEDKYLIKRLDKLYSEILMLLKDRLGIVTKNYYQTNWFLLGGVPIGLPIGLIIFSITKNPAFIPIGISIGISIGWVIGMLKDKKAKDENRQIQIEEI